MSGAAGYYVQTDLLNFQREGTCQVCFAGISEGNLYIHRLTLIKYGTGLRSFRQRRIPTLRSVFV
ncbi:MAG: hypothetical protein WCO98_01635 [bacterium]